MTKYSKIDQKNSLPEMEGYFFDLSYLAYKAAKSLIILFKVAEGRIASLANFSLGK